MYYIKQKRLFFIMIAATASLLIFVFLVQPSIQGIRALEKRIERKEKELTEMVFLGKELIKARTKLSSLERSALNNKEKEALNSILSAIAEKSDIKKALISTESKHTTLSSAFIGNEVVMKFEGITWKGIIDFLKIIEERREIIRLKRLSLKTRFDKPALLNGSLIIYVLERK